jgi:thiol-disulfide isomerase/thioredoxin
MSGERVMLQHYLKTGPVLINFWATWCAPCKKEMKHLDAFEKKYKDKGFSVLAVSNDSQKSLSKVRSYIRANKFSFQVFLDPNNQVLKKLFSNAMPVLPANILVGQDGTVLWRHFGYIPGDEKKMEAEIIAALQPE